MSAYSEHRELVEFYSKILHDTYGKYATFLHIIISLAGATTLIFFNSIKFEELPQYQAPHLAVLAIVFSGIALIMALVWRSATQHYMEHECFGSEEDMDTYFQICGIQSVTQTHKRSRLRKAYRVVYRITQILTLPTLTVAWIMVIRFVLRNIGQS